MAFGILFRDKNLLAENIKKGVKILKVTGTCEGGRPINNQDIAADSSVALQTFTAGEGYDGIGVFTLRPYSKENRMVDSSTSVQVITPETSDCLWTVLVNPYILDSKTVDSSTVSQTVVSSADGLGSVTVNPYTLDSKTVDSSTVQQVVTSSVDGLSSVTVNAVTSSIDSNITAGNIKTGVSILGVTGSYGTDGNWVANARKNDNVDLSGYTLKGYANYNYSGTKNYGYANLLRIYNTQKSVYKYPTLILGADWGYSYDRQHVFEYAFYDRYSTYEYTANDPYVIRGPHMGQYTLQYAFARSNNNRNDVLNVVFSELSPWSDSIFDRCMQYAFYNNGGLRSVSFQAMTGMYNSYFMESAFMNCNRLTTVDFPELTTVQGYYTLENTFRNCTSLTTVNFPKLVTLQGTAFNNTFSGCSSLVSMSFPELVNAGPINSFFSESTTTVSTPKLTNYSSTSDAIYPFPSNNSVTTVTTHPNALKGTGRYNFYRNCNNVTSLTLTGMASDDLNLDNMGSLDRTSIVGVLQHLDTNTSGKTCTFYTSGLTVLDDSQHSVQGIYDLAVQAGWTINNLIIDNPDLMITHPRTGVLNPFGTENYIEFTSADSWTASVDDNDITLSSYSGSAGTGITIDVTAVSGWSGDATVTITSNGNTKTIPIGLYTRLQYIDAGTTMSNYIDMGFDMEQGDYIQAYYKYNGTPTGGHFISNGGVYSNYGWQFRTFAYSSSLYLDAGGGESSNSRYYNSNPWSLVNQKFGWVESGINSSSYPYFKNPVTGDTWTGGTAFTRFTGTDGHTMRYMGDNTSLNEVKVFHNGVMTHDFVAAKVDGAVGLYDTVTNTFKGVTAGSITPGPEGNL